MEYKIKDQYKTAENLNTRANLHSYNINKVNWTNWCFDQMHFPPKARILEIGCGTGALWHDNINKLDKEWNITLSDFSEGMLKSAKERLDRTCYDFNFEIVDTQNIPYEDGTFDVVIARHMLYLVPDIEKAISEMKRVLKKGGFLYITTNSIEAMSELNELMEEFDASLGLHNNGMVDRFALENGQLLLKKYFNEIEVETLEGKIVVDCPEPVVSYKASTIRGREIFTEERQEQFTKFLDDYIKRNRRISITTRACIFKVKNI